MAYITDTFNHYIKEDIFHTETIKVLQYCDRIFYFNSNPFKYHGCYRSPARRDVLYKARKKWYELGGTKDNFIPFGKYCLREWEKTHPDEVAKEKLSEGKKRAEINRRIHKVISIGVRHGFYLMWGGVKKHPEFWEIYRMEDCSLIGYIRCDW